MILPRGFKLPLYVFELAEGSSYGDLGTDVSGKFVGHHKALDPVLLCPTCGRLRHRLDVGWLCISCPLAGRIVDDQVIIETALRAGVVQQHVKDRGEIDVGRWEEVRRLLRFLKGRSKWMRRLGATEADVAGLKAPKAKAPGQKRKRVKT